MQKGFWLSVMLFWTSSVLVSWNLTGVESSRSSRLISVRPLTGLIMGGFVFKLREAGVGGLILKVFQNFLSSRTQRGNVDGVCSSSFDVVSGVPQGSPLVHCCSCCTLLTFQGCFRMSWLVMLMTLPCFVGYHILVIGHL